MRRDYCQDQKGIDQGGGPGSGDYPGDGGDCGEHRAGRYGGHRYGPGQVCPGLLRGLHPEEAAGPAGAQSPERQPGPHSGEKRGEVQDGGGVETGSESIIKARKIQPR